MTRKLRVILHSLMRVHAGLFRVDRTSRTTAISIRADLLY